MIAEPLPYTMIRRVRFFTMVALAMVLACVALWPRSAHAVDLLDGNADFKLLAELGFEQAVDGPHAQGTRTNDYMWSMAWFKGKLYVGTGRFEIDPATNVPRAGQIWRYTPGGVDGRSGTWAFAYESPTLTVAGYPVNIPREFGYRWMTTCNFAGVDYLFISTIGVTQGNILYTSDGVNFQTVGRGGYPTGTIGFRTIACFKDPIYGQSLITTPVGKGGDAQTFDSDRTDNPIVLANSSPVSGGGWRNYSPMGMGDSKNGAIFTLMSTGKYVYAGVTNEVTGGQLWRTEGGCLFVMQGNCMPTWTKVLDRGGGRPKTASGLVKNDGFADIVEFNGDLYLAMSAPGLDGNAIRAELLRYRADGTFEVLIGEPRMDAGFTRGGAPTSPTVPSNLRCGLPLENLNGVGGADDCPPTTRRGAGLGVPGNATIGYPDGPQFYFWRLFNYAYNRSTAPLGDNRLYLTTAQGALDAGGIATFGFDFLATANGVAWSTITNDGFGFIQQQGLRSIAATPYGLAVGGTHFPVPPGVQMPYPDPEIRGGNVWMGAPTAAPVDSVPPVTTLASPPSPAEGATLTTRSVSLAWSGTDGPAPGSLPLTYAYRLDPLEASFSAFGAATSKTYTNLGNGTYTFYVIARDSQGNTEAVGAPGAGNRRTFTVDAPDAPPSVTITVKPADPNLSAMATFAWVGADDVTPAGSLTYKYWLAPLEGDPGSFVAGTSKTYTGLVDGAYTFHVQAKDGAGNPSAEVTYGFTVAVPAGPPARPVPATVALVGTRTLRVSWADVAGETRYEVERCLMMGRACTFEALAPNVAAGSTSYDDVVSVAGTYAYRVRACNASGCSDWASTPAINVR